MKTASPALQEHFGQDCTTLAVLWKVLRSDGVIMGFTTHDQDISYQAAEDSAPVLYWAATGLSNTASESGSDMSVDNVEVTAFLDSSALSEADIEANVYDNAQIWQRVVNWADLTMGDMIQRVGFLGTVKMVNGMFTAELRGLTQKLTTAIGSTYGPICRAELGSNPTNDDGSWRPWYCNVNLSEYEQNGTVESSPDAMTLVPASGLVEIGSSSPTEAAGAGWFDNGLLTFTSGALQGRTFDIKTWDGTQFNMFLPFPIQPQPGDNFTVTPGCDNTLSNTGCLKFNNAANFRGEPTIPGQDLVLNYPNAKP